MPFVSVEWYLIAISNDLGKLIVITSWYYRSYDVSTLLPVITISTIAKFM
jgi:hypothetical protein